MSAKVKQGNSSRRLHREQPRKAAELTAPLSLRVDKTLRAEIAALAERERRSLTGQAIVLIERGMAAAQAESVL